MKQKHLNLKGYYYQGEAGDLHYMVVVKEDTNGIDDIRSSDLISNSSFLLKFRTKRVLKKLVKEFLRVTNNQNSSYELNFNSAVKH